MSAQTTTAVARAEAAWGADLPDWVRVLAEEADRSSQARTATAIGYSAAVVSYVLKRSYTGDLAKVEEAVRASLMEAAVECPELGTMPLADCLDWQKKAEAFHATSGRRRLMYHACRNCSRLKGGA